MPDGLRVVMSRRRFLVQSTTLVGAGTVLGAGSVIAASRLTSHPSAAPGSVSSDAPVGTEPDDTSTRAPADAPASAPGGVLPTPSGASPDPIESPPPPGPGRAGRENLRKGTNAWELPLRVEGNVEAYASDVSVAPGDRLAILVSSPSPTAAVTLYRLGWYNERGARVIERWRDLPITPQPAATTDSHTGLIRADWAPAVTATVPEGWVSGLYLGVVSATNGAPQYCTFVVREQQRAAPILFVSAATTHQAYNAWGGKSLYPDESTGPATISGGANGVVASFDRPYLSNRGAGDVLRWEYPFVRWMESRGYDVAYAADLDLERHPELAVGRRLIVFVGHPEYWSAAMRQTIENAIAAGTNVAFFSANEMYWRVRFDAAGGGQYRSVTCYRRAEIDPVAAEDPVHATVKWRDLPAKAPESLVIGQMYGHVVKTPADFVCSAPDHWIYAGTGMRAGDAIADLVGQEYDRFWPNPALSPPGTQVLAVSPVSPNFDHDISIYGHPAPDEPQPPVHNATIYTAPSGSTVFSAGTMQWSWGLDDWGALERGDARTMPDWRVARITANILDRLSGEAG